MVESQKLLVAILQAFATPIGLRNWICGSYHSFEKPLIFLIENGDLDCLPRTTKMGRSLVGSWCFEKEGATSPPYSLKSGAYKTPCIDLPIVRPLSEPRIFRRHHPLEQTPGQRRAP